MEGFNEVVDVVVPRYCSEDEVRLSLQCLSGDISNALTRIQECK